MDPLETYLKATARHSIDGGGRPRNVLLSRFVEPAQRDRQEPQAQGPLRHQPGQPRRRHPRRRPVHARPVQEGRRRTRCRASALARRDRGQVHRRRRGRDRRRRAGRAVLQEIRPGAGDELPRLRAGRPRPIRQARRRWSPIAWPAAKRNSGRPPRHPRTAAEQHGERFTGYLHAGHAAQRAAGRPQRPGLVPGLLRPRRPGPRQGQQPARPGQPAQGPGRVAGHEVPGRARRALLPLHAGPDAFLRRVLRLGAVGQGAPAEPTRTPVRLA